ncbi:MAG: ribokinase [Synergistaceae bacterium]|nr:ribokinase [Synergistaceae bacterium]
MKTRILVYGSYAVGMTMKCGSFPSAGQTVPGYSFQQFHGGKGSNQAIAAARLGGNVCYVSCVGRDMLGDAAIELFKNEGLDARVKRSETRATGVGFCMVDDIGESRIIIDFGASNEVSSKDIDELRDVLASSQILLTQLESDMDTVLYAARLARSLGVTVILNPAPYRAMPDELIRNVDVITPNETEARQMLGMPADADISDESTAQKLMELGIGKVIITLGKNGALLADENDIQRIPIKRLVTPVDTTGAGDAFAGALVVALSEGKSYADAVSWANEAASLSVTRYGVVESLPYRNEL